MSPARALCVVAWATALLAPLPVHAQEASAPSTEGLDDADLQHLVEAAELWGLTSETALLADAPRQRVALREVVAIDEQHIIAHVVGALSLAAGIGDTVLALFEQHVLRAVVGAAALAGLGIAVGLHVDARDRWQRWNLLLAPTGGGLALRF